MAATSSRCGGLRAGDLADRARHQHHQRLRGTARPSRWPATVDDLSAGRFILGSDRATRCRSGAEHGIAYAKPLTRTRETVAVIRALLRDGRVEYRGETVRIEGSIVVRAAPAGTDLSLGGVREMTELCGEIADGVILTRSTLGTAPQRCGRLWPRARSGPAATQPP
jgi:alkanesulfonate monooxygenase SsuD/methylene tetrahydromethanopterin reductase-like flavin-dependent oxidoreductase (luciferase family)